MEQLTREREPTGQVTRAEDAATGEQLFALTIALEDTVWLLNDDHRRTRAFVDQATRRVELSRLPPCRWWQVQCRLERRALVRELDAPPPAP